MKMFRKDEGFTLVELMVVVLIIGILVAIAVPVFLNASANAAAKSCQANQRTINGAVTTYQATTGTSLGVATAGTAELLNGTGTTGVLRLVGSYVKTAPTCPTSTGYYTMLGDPASVISDLGASTNTTFTAGPPSHQLN
jgi:type IV pilus assembly protein PilA